MAQGAPDVARQALRTMAWETMTDAERRAVDALLRRGRVTRNTNVEFLRMRSLGDRVADRLAQFGGSWLFIGLFGLTLAAWVLLNTVLLPARDAFDPFPFIFLNLFLSMLAAVQAPIILMSQNRQAEKDRLDAAADYEVNLKAELEIHALHDKMDTLREAQWLELVKLQQEQIALLRAIVARQQPAAAS